MGETTFCIRAFSECLRLLLEKVEGFTDYLRFCLWQKLTLPKGGKIGKSPPRRIKNGAETETDRRRNCSKKKRFMHDRLVSRTVSSFKVARAFFAIFLYLRRSTAALRARCRSDRDAGVSQTSTSQRHRRLQTLRAEILGNQ